MRQARRHFWVVTRAQALESGMTPDAIRSKLDSGRWQRIHQGVYLTHSGALTWDSRTAAALLYAGEGAALGLHTAAHWSHLISQRPRVIQVLIPSTRRVRSVPGVVVRRRRAPYAAGLVSGLPTTTTPQTLIDMAAEPGQRVDDVVSYIARACQMGRTYPEALLNELRRRPRHPHRELLRFALWDVASGIESYAELAFLNRVVRRHGLPPMRCQTPTGDGGRRDFESDYGLIVEIDGALFHVGGQLRRDRRRDRAALRQGKVTMRAGWVDVAVEPCELAVDMALMLRQLGWDGWPKPCSPTCAVHRVLRGRTA